MAAAPATLIGVAAPADLDLLAGLDPLVEIQVLAVTGERLSRRSAARA